MRLLDTNIVSYLFKEHHLMNAYLPLTVGRDLAVSFQTVGELREGVLLRNWSQTRRRKLEKFMEQFSILQSDDVMSAWWAHVRAVRQIQPISVADAWVAATALSYDLDLVTHNPKDFQNIPGLRVLSIIK